MLRTYQREQDAIEAHIEADEAGALAHPAWLAERLRTDWPDAYRTLLSENNAPPPLTLRVNRLQLSRADYLAELAGRGIAATPSRVTGSAVTLDPPIPVERIPGFSAGAVSVQDAAAQLAAGLLELSPGLRVLDLCAAPGGKTTHSLETCPALGELVAVDQSAERMNRVKDNLNRIGLTATLVTADALAPPTWWDGRPFDRILLDAPCSATGVIRRHPDIKVLRQPADLKELAITQQQMLERAWTMLAPGGRLVYATCSVIRDENAVNIARFLSGHDDAGERPITADWGIPQTHGRQILTGAKGMDGFYYARLEKRGARA
jgi:16S rRNA (cytosine967-C5)-methyltransferase